jgi:hypothetical protein
VTDDNGRFSFAGLAPGRFTLTVSKPAYLSTTYGATRMRSSGTSIELAAGATVTNLVVPIARGATISGVVRDESGEPASGVGIVVLARSPTGFTRALEMSRMSAFTDDRGAYRVYGLPEGDYAVAVIPLGPTEVTVMTNALVDAAIRVHPSRSSIPAHQAPVRRRGWRSAPAKSDRESTSCSRSYRSRRSKACFSASTARRPPE